MENNQESFEGFDSVGMMRVCCGVCISSFSIFEKKFTCNIICLSIYIHM